jgi:hypothetical protein
MRPDCALRYAEVMALRCVNRRLRGQPTARPSAYLKQEENEKRQGSESYDDFTSSVLRRDVIMDAKHRLADVSALARGNWSR